MTCIFDNEPFDMDRFTRLSPENRIKYVCAYTCHITDFKSGLPDKYEITAKTASEFVSQAKQLKGKFVALESIKPALGEEEFIKFKKVCQAFLDSRKMSKFCIHKNYPSEPCS